MLEDLITDFILHIFICVLELLLQTLKNEREARRQVHDYHPTPDLEHPLIESIWEPEEDTGTNTPTTSLATLSLGGTPPEKKPRTSIYESPLQKYRRITQEQIILEPISIPKDLRTALRKRNIPRALTQNGYLITKFGYLVLREGVTFDDLYTSLNQRCYYCQQIVICHCNNRHCDTHTPRNCESLFRLDCPRT